MRPRLAPSAVRTAISRRRPAPRASKRLATLTQAMSRSTVVAPISAPVIVRSSLPMAALRYARASPARGPRDSRAGNTRAPSSALACSSVTPGASRPSTETVRDPAAAAPDAGKGIHISLVLGKRNPGGITPAMTCVVVSRRMRRPSTFGSAWYRRRHTESLMRTSLGADECPTADSKPLPRCGMMPSVGKRLGVICCTPMRSASPPSMSVAVRPA